MSSYKPSIRKACDEIVKTSGTEIAHILVDKNNEVDTEIMNCFSAFSILSFCQTSRVLFAWDWIVSVPFAILIWTLVPSILAAKTVSTSLVSSNSKRVVPRASTLLAACSSTRCWNPPASAFLFIIRVFVRWMQFTARPQQDRYIVRGVGVGLWRSNYRRAAKIRRRIEGKRGEESLRGHRACMFEEGV